MSSPDADLTPESASPTDIAPLGRGAVPPHERTAAEEAGMADWEAIARDRDFHTLLRAKAAFIVPCTLLFVVYYFALPISVGWFPEVMRQKIVGNLNVAYLFALSQFFMAWTLAGLYVGVAMGWDAKAAAILAKFRKN